MSRGLSHHQNSILLQLEAMERRHSKVKFEDMFAFPWSEPDFGEINHRKPGPALDFRKPKECFAELTRHNWNREQTIRRSLRSLERRKLVSTSRYAFTLVRVGSSFYWDSTLPRAHVPGQSHIMTGVQLTDAGRKLARAMKRAAKKHEKEQTATDITWAMQEQKKWLEQHADRKASAKGS
jgi:hypothetical protein